MDTDAVHEASVSYCDINAGDSEAESSKIDLVVEVSSGGETSGELATADEILTRVELDSARASEKLVNLNLLMMHAANKEIDFEAFALSKEHMHTDSMEKAMESDLLSRILDSEVMELDKFMTTLQTDILEVGKRITSYEYLGEYFLAMEGKLRDSEKSLKQSQDQLSEIRTQAARFQNTLSCLDGEEHWNGDKMSRVLEDGQFFSTKAKINMQTAEQQRHILRMLEKSLAREMDLEKKLIESRKIEEELKHRLLSEEQEVFFMEEDAAVSCERLFKAENAAEILMGISKELLGRLQILQFNLNGSLQQETEVSSKLAKSMEEVEARETAVQEYNSSSEKLNAFLIGQTDSLKSSLTEAEDKLIIADSEAFTLREKVNLLEKQRVESEFELSNAKVANKSQEQENVLCSEITELENTVENLKEKLSKAESRAESAEVRCNLLVETNMELNEELGRLKGKSEKLDSLEKQLREYDISLQHAVASVDASQEKQNMLYSTIRDMENLIEDLKLKASKAESRADRTEDKCVILSESNAELNEEVKFLRGRLECVEASWSQAKETKVATANEIGFRTKVITDLVMQLATERERLHKQMSSVALENKALVAKVQQKRKDTFEAGNCCNKGNRENHLSPEYEVICASANSSQLDKSQKNVSVSETEVTAAASMSDLNGVRRINAGLLSSKHFFVALLILLVAVAVAYVLQ